MQPNNVQHFLSIERTLSKTLVNWSVASVVLGTSAALIANKFNKKNVAEFGRQTAAWGVVDLGIVGVGYLAQRRRGTLSEEQVPKQSRNLRRLLLVNAVADVAYMAGGIAVVRRSLQKKSSLRMGPGDGSAIVIQGAFLFILDVSQAKRL